MEKKYVFISKELVAGSFGESAFCKFSIEIMHGAFSFEQIAGRAPTVEEFFSAVTETLFEDNCPIPFAGRTNHYRIARRTGYSGCEDMFLEELKGGDVVRHHVLHISMDGKVNNNIKAAWLDDVLQVGLAMGYFDKKFEENKYHFRYDEFGYKWFVRLLKRAPRNINNEPGWCTPEGYTLSTDEAEIPEIYEKSGGYSIPSILDEGLGEYWDELKEKELDAQREEAESHVG